MYPLCGSESIISNGFYKKELHHYFQAFDKSELFGVKYVYIDMYESYKIILHVKRTTKDSELIYLLLKLRDILFRKNINSDNEAKYYKRLCRYLNLRQILYLIFDKSPEIKIAYDLMQNYLYINESVAFLDAEAWLDGIMNQFIESQISEFEESHMMLQNWRQ